SAPWPLVHFKVLPGRPDLPARPVMSGQLALKALKGFKATLAQPALRDHPVQMEQTAPMELTEPTERLEQRVRLARPAQVLHLTPMKETGATATRLKEQLHFRVLMVQVAGSTIRPTVIRRSPATPPAIIIPQSVSNRSLPTRPASTTW